MHKDDTAIHMERKDTWDRQQVDMRIVIRIRNKRTIWDIRVTNGINRETES